MVCLAETRELPTIPGWFSTPTRPLNELYLSARGYGPCWNEEVPPFNVMVHRLSGATGHDGHAQILRDGLGRPSGINPTVRR